MKSGRRGVQAGEEIYESIGAYDTTAVYWLCICGHNCACGLVMISAGTCLIGRSLSCPLVSVLSQLV